MKTGVKTEWVTDDFGHSYISRKLFAGRTPFQKMEIRRNPTFGTILFLDGKIQISDRDENRYHQYLVDAPLLAHPNPQSLCVVGGGDCFSLEEAVKHPGLERLLMLEIDKGVVDFCIRHYPAIRRVMKDRRIEIVYSDARRYLENTDERFDVMVIDLTEPHGPSKMLYTREFYRMVANRLLPGGILSIHTDNYFLFPRSYATIHRTLRSVFPHIMTAYVDMPCFGMGWTYRLASKSSISLGRMEKNVEAFRRRGVVFDQFTPTSYLVRPTPEETAVLKKFGRISTDACPFDKFEKFKKYVTK